MPREGRVVFSETLRLCPVTDSYSVTEAADALGVPPERIWELVARGVLAGEADSDGVYRVYLKPPPPTAVPTERAAEAATNGNGHGDADFGWRVFREVLTEFRTLTERYGQALLALGEARGEVAALRGRVDLLEARLDPLLPHRPAAVAAWQGPSRLGDEPAPAQLPSREVREETTAPAPDAGAYAAAAEGEPPPVSFSVGPDPAPHFADGLDAGWPEDEAALRADDMGTEAEFPAAYRAPYEAPARIDFGRAAGGLGRSRLIRRHRLAEDLRRRERSRYAAVAGIPEALARADDPTVQLLPARDMVGEGLDIEASLVRPVEATSIAVAQVEAAPIRVAPFDTQPPAVGDEPDLRAFLAASVPDDVDPIEWVERILAPSIATRPFGERAAAEAAEEPMPEAVGGEEAEPIAEERPELEPSPALAQLADDAAPVRLPGIEELEAALASLVRPPAREHEPAPPVSAFTIRNAAEPSAEAPQPPPAAIGRWAVGFDPAAFRRQLVEETGDPPWLRGRRGPAATAYRRLRRLFPG
jgi:hypothetical protein